MTQKQSVTVPLSLRFYFSTDVSNAIRLLFSTVNTDILNCDVICRKMTAHQNVFFFNFVTNINSSQPVHLFVFSLSQFLLYPRQSADRNAPLPLRRLLCFLSGWDVGMYDKPYTNRNFHAAFSQFPRRPIHTQYSILFAIFRRNLGLVSHMLNQINMFIIYSL